MAREHSHVKKRRRGCLGGCLTRILLLLGLCAVLLVGACVLGLVKNDPQTGKPSLSLEGVGLDSVQLPDLGNMQLPDLGGLELPEGSMDGALEWAKNGLSAWPYAVSRSGLTIKTLRAGDGEAVLVCADGYTMLVGGGSGMGAALTAQLLLSGAGHLNAAVAMSADAAQIGGMPLAITLIRPAYLIYPASQTKGRAYNRLLESAGRSEKTQLLAPKHGLSFMLGRAQVTIVGPSRIAHTDERDDGLSLRIDYGHTSVLIMGSITSSGERELITSGVNLDADALICSLGGSEEATSQAFVQAVSPAVALMTGKEPANAVRVRLSRAGAQVYTAKEHGVMTLVSDGQTMVVRP